MFVANKRFIEKIILGCTGMAYAVAASAAPTTVQLIDIREPSLPRALAELARKTGAELLFDERLVRDHKATPVRGRLSANAALATLLAGSGIGYRTTPDGAFVLFVLPSEALPASDGAISEVLIVGRKTQNVDIRRTENDIQPYKVATGREIEAAHRDNVEQYLRGREPADVQISTPTQDTLTELGSTRSEVNLRGLGPQRTLALIDGRRMPSLPNAQGEFGQSDLNGVPLGAIDRMEILTSTSGGIYGPSAIGGVVNVVLRRDYRGAEFNVIGGITDRGDAGRLRLEARVGFTPDGGATDVMLFVAHSISDSLLLGQRDYADRARARAFANNPVGYLELTPSSNAVRVSGFGQDLVLDSTLGGASLGSSFTFLPVNFTGTPAERVAALVANAGKASLELAEDRSGAKRYLISNPTVTSGLFNIRRRLGPKLEAYADGLYFRNDGTTKANAVYVFNAVADAPDNPFSQFVDLRFPTPVFDQKVRTRTEITRFSLGLIASLPSDWGATGDITIGRAIVDRDLAIRGPTGDLSFAIRTGLAPPGGQPAVDPLGDWPTFVAATQAYVENQTIRIPLTNHYRDASVRVAGPAIRLPGGPLTLTMVGEVRREHIPVSTVLLMFGDREGSIELPLRTKVVKSGYAELRAPIAPDDAGPVLFRGLELQLAGRYDHTSTTLPDNAQPGSPSNDRLTTVREGSAVFTAGGRIRPTPWLMLRASVATGELPPSISQLQAGTSTVSGDRNQPADPQRGGRRISLEVPYLSLSGGSHDIRSEQGRTVSIGAVLNPEGQGGPRVSVDYSHIVTHHEIIDFPLTAEELLAAEATYPDRVVRAPLTAADAAVGFTAGPVTLLDTSVINAGSMVVEALDLKLDWRLPAGEAGDFRLYGSATWQPTVKRRGALGQPSVNRVGFADGPLKWRGNVGLEWTSGPLMIDLNAQYFHSYRVAFADTSDGRNADRVLFQGAERFPSQVYVDLGMSRRFEVRGPGGLPSVLEVRLGVQNLFDQRPPIDADPASERSYSPYGDPRRRRFELAISSRF